MRGSREVAGSLSYIENARCRDEQALTRCPYV
jgi:hypothetical protein